MKRVLFLLFSLALVVLPFSARAEAIGSEAVVLENIIAPEASVIVPIETISEIVSETEPVITNPSDLIEVEVNSDDVVVEDPSSNQVVVEENISTANSISDSEVEENSTTEETLSENSEVFFSSAVSSEFSSEIELDSSFNNRHGDEINLYHSCADLNRDGILSDLDPMVIVDYIFGGGAIPDGVNIDVDSTGNITISDAVFLINYMKAGGPAPKCAPIVTSCSDLNRDGILSDLDPMVIVDYIFNGGSIEGINADTDGNGIITISDAVYLVNYFKAGGPAPKCLPVNSAPVFVNFNPPTEVKFGETYSYDVEASDADEDILSFSIASSSPSGMSIASSTGIISWAPTEAQISATAYSVTVFVSDGLVEASSTFSILVKAKTETPGGGGGGGGGGGPSVNVPGSYGGGALINYVPASSTPNQAPFFVNFNPAQNATATWLYIYDVEASDPENNPITYGLLEAPFGMSIISQTGFIYWRPSLDQVSATPYRVTIQISDGSNTTSTSYFVRVSNPGPLSFVPLQINIVEAQTENTNQNSELPIQSTSTTTSTPTSTAEVPESGNRNLAAIFFTGLLDFFKNLGLWLWASPCRLVLFVLLLLILWLVYLKLRSEEDEVKNNNSNGSNQSFRNIEKTSSSTALGNDNNAVMFQEKDLKPGSDSEKVIELTSPLNLDFGKKPQDGERNVD